MQAVGLSAGPGPLTGGHGLASANSPVLIAYSCFFEENGRRVAPAAV
jgi:Na+/glutamate symporter